MYTYVRTYAYTGEPITLIITCAHRSRKHATYAHQCVRYSVPTVSGGTRGALMGIEVSTRLRELLMPTAQGLM